jgi:putative inorganic carbon (HCO3(-)) transporter
MKPMDILKLDDTPHRQTILAVIIVIILGGIAVGFGSIFIDNLLYPVLAVLGLAVVLITIRKPQIGLLVLVFITYTRLSNVLVDYHNLPSVMKFYIPFLAGIIALRWLVKRDEPRGWQVAFVVMAIYGFVNGISTLFAPNPTLAIDEFTEFIKDTIMVIVIVLLLNKGVTLRNVVWTLLLAGIFLGSLTVYQQLTGSFDNNFGGFAVAEVRNIAGEVNDYRAQGPISSNFYALILVVLVPLGLDRLLNEKSLVLRLLAVWALAVINLSIFFTYSRGGLLTLFVVTAVMLYRYPPKPIYILVAVFGLVLIYLVVPASYIKRLSNLTQILSLVDPQQELGSTLEENALRGRLSEMTVSALVFADHPLTGVGYANFEEYYLEYAPSLGLDPRRENRAAHSLYLEIAAETGIIGLAAFGFLLFAAFRSLQWSYTRFRDQQLNDYANLTYALGVSLVGYLAGSFFLHAAYFRYFWLIFGIVCSIPQVAKFELESLAQERERAMKLKNKIRSDRLKEKIFGRIFRAHKDLNRILLSHDTDEKQVLFILGSQRSGTTLMTKILEKDWTAKVYPEHSELSSDDTLDGLRLNSFPKVYRVISRNRYPLVVLKPLVESQNIDKLIKSFPGSKVVWMLRHYKDVAASNLERFGIDNGIKNLRYIATNQNDNWRTERLPAYVTKIVKSQFSETMNPYDAAALFWFIRNTIYFTHNLDKEPAVYVCYYSDLVEQPGIVMKEIYTFTGHPYPGDQIVIDVFKSSVGRGQHIELSPAIEKLCQAMWNQFESNIKSPMGQPGSSSDAG